MTKVPSSTSTGDFPFKRRTSGDGTRSATTFLPFELKRRHVSKLLILPNGADSSKSVPTRVDPMLVLTVAKAFYWQQLLDSGQVRNASDLARRFGVNKAWVSEVLRLTRLSPDILAAVVGGIQPRWLTLQRLRGRSAEVPITWCRQTGI